MTNLRQLLKEDMKKNNWKCNCIRCREIKDNDIDPSETTFEIINYKANGGIEYFIFLINKNFLIGFIRLRLFIHNDSHDSDDSKMLYVLKGSALIRELHIYSNISNCWFF